jgi:hypothetical protein
MVNRNSAAGLQVRQYFHCHTEDALDLCDVLGSYVPGGKVKLDEVSKILGLPGKPDKELDWSEGQARSFVLNRKSANHHLCKAVAFVMQLPKTIRQQPRPEHDLSNEYCQSRR